MARANPSPRRVGVSQSGRVETLDRDLQKQLILVRLAAAGFQVPEPVAGGMIQELAFSLLDTRSRAGSFPTTFLR